MSIALESLTDHLQRTGKLGALALLESDAWDGVRNRLVRVIEKGVAVEAIDFSPEAGVP